MKFPERFQIISGENIEEEIRKIETNFAGIPRKIGTKNYQIFSVNLKKL